MPSGQTLDSQSQVLFLKLTTAEIDCSLWISNTSLNLDLLGSDYSNTHTHRYLLIYLRVSYLKEFPQVYKRLLVFTPMSSHYFKG